MSTHLITELLNDSLSGNEQALGQVYELLYSEIKSIARIQLSRLQPGQTITPTVLVNECFLRIQKNQSFEAVNKKHFMNCLALCMRRYLIDQLRSQKSAKRDGQPVDHSITEVVGTEDVCCHLFDLELLLNKVMQIDPQLAEVLQYKLFLNLTFKEMSGVLEVSEKQLKRRWKQAKILILTISGESHTQQGK